MCTDHKLDLLRLVTIIEAKLSEAYKDGGAVCALKVKEAVKLCLSRIHVVHCTSCSELSSSLDHLRATFLPCHPEVAAVVLDSVASFYWIDKARLSKTADRPSSEPWVKAMSQLIRDQHLVLFAAKPLLIGRADEATNMAKVFVKVHTHTQHTHTHTYNTHNTHTHTYNTRTHPHTHAHTHFAPTTWIYITFP